MSKSEILYVKGMNISESEGDEEDEEEDIWDDTKLNDAYDRALRVANAEVAKRVAMSTNKQGDNEGQFKPKTEHKSPSRPQACKNSRKEPWKAGMPCRAVYEGDGQEYEAFVLRIINDKECIVRFLGYDNTEIISISDLKATLGKDTRTQQIQQALNEKTDDGFSQSNHVEGMEFSDHAPSVGSTVTISERNFQRKKKSSKKKKGRNAMGGFELPEMPMPNMTEFRNLNSMDIPMPPPPLTLPTSDRVDAEEQAVSSMLLSWYMSGYYTGLYQGLKRAKENRRK